MATEASTLAADLLAQLGRDFSVPEIDLSDESFRLPPREDNPRYEDIPSLGLTSLTTGSVGGTGAFDRIMDSVKAHLKEQYEGGRISGDQYAKTYIELTTAALSTALQFVLQNNQAYWSAVTAQSQARQAEIDAVRAGVELETAKHQLAGAVHQAEILRAQYVLTQMQIAGADAAYELTSKQVDKATYEIDALLPSQKALVDADTSIKEYQLGSLMPAELEGIQTETAIKEYQVSFILPAQHAGQERDNEIKDYQLEYILPAQKDLTLEQMESQRAQTLDERSDGADVSGMLGRQFLSEETRRELAETQIGLVSEQKEAQRAQTLDVRTDNAAVKGLIGKQKDLYTQQVESYQRDGEAKVGKMYLDAWITQKTLDEGLLAPEELKNAGVDSVLSKIRTNLGLT